MTDRNGYYWKLRVKRYDPDQPRVPAGDPRGGQWTSEGGTVLRLPGSMIVQRDLFSGSPIPEPSEQDRRILDRVVDRARKTINHRMLPLSYTFQEVIIGDILGAQTSFKGGPDKGREVIALAPSKVRKALEKHHGARTMKMWNKIQGDVTYESMMEHVIAHEIGHFWMARQYGDVYRSWEKVAKENWAAMSGLAHHYKDVDEAFADSFAAFLNGYDMNPVVEDWFMENVK